MGKARNIEIVHTILTNSVVIFYTQIEKEKKGKIDA